MTFEICADKFFAINPGRVQAPVETARAPSFRAAAPANGAPPQRAETQAASGRWISVMQPPVLRTIGADAARRNQKRATLGLSGDGSEVTPSKVAQPVAKTLFTMVLLDSQSRQQILQRCVHQLRDMPYLFQEGLCIGESRNIFCTTTFALTTDFEIEDTLTRS